MLRIDNITKQYDATTVLHGVSLTVGKGELWTLLGPSGCGKTTLLRIIAGLERQSGGTVWIGNTDVSLLPPFSRSIGMVFQSYALFPHLTVQENIRYGLEVLRIPAPAMTTTVRDIARVLGLERLLARQVHQLSGGQQQRVALARALVLKPNILLFDEPLSNLDAKLRRGIREEIRSVQQQFGITAIYVTHDQSEALAISDRVVVLNEGQIAQCGTPQELYEQPANPFVAHFIGDANLYPVAVQPVNVATVRVTLADFTWEQPAPVVAATRYQLLLRPDRITLQPHGPGIAGVIQRATYVGTTMEYRMQFSGGSVFAVMTDTTHPLAPGTPVFCNPTLARPALVPC